MAHFTPAPLNGLKATPILVPAHWVYETLLADSPDGFVLANGKREKNGQSKLPSTTAVHEGTIAIFDWKYEGQIINHRKGPAEKAFRLRIDIGTLRDTNRNCYATFVNKDDPDIDEEIRERHMLKIEGSNTPKIVIFAEPVTSHHFIQDRTVVTEEECTDMHGLGGYHPQVKVRHWEYVDFKPAFKNQDLEQTWQNVMATLWPRVQRRNRREADRYVEAERKGYKQKSVFVEDDSDDEEV